MTGKTAAERLMDRGRADEAVHSRRAILLEQLRARFGRIPGIEPLDGWLRAFVDAETIDDVGIMPQDH